MGNSSVKTWREETNHMIQFGEPRTKCVIRFLINPPIYLFLVDKQFRNGCNTIFGIFLNTSLISSLWIGSFFIFSGHVWCVCLMVCLASLSHTSHLAHKTTIPPRRAVLHDLWMPASQPLPANPLLGVVYTAATALNAHDWLLISQINITVTPGWSRCFGIYWYLSYLNSQINTAQIAEFMF